MEELIRQLVTYEVGISIAGTNSPQTDVSYVATVVDFCLKLDRRFV